MEATPRRTTWSDIQHYVDFDGQVIDAEGRTWRRRRWSRPAGRATGRTLFCLEGDFTRTWVPDDGEIAMLPAPPIPEPPNGTRIEFEHHTDLYAAWRDDEDGSEDSGAGDDGRNWVLYGESVSHTWAEMWAWFGESLRTAVRLVPVAEDLPLLEQRPTVIWARERAAKGGDERGQE